MPASDLNTYPSTSFQADTLPGYSRFVQRLRRRYSSELALLPSGPLDRNSLVQTYAALQAQGLNCANALRVLRQLVMERLITLDCASDRNAQLPLNAVTLAVTYLAEFALDAACQVAFAELDEVHGAPMAASTSSRFMPLEGEAVRPPQRAELWVIGMGKLGARELNVSSDIDLIYVYDHDGDTCGNAAGRGQISNHEYFVKAVKRLYALVGDTTEHGFVFRVDLALRPNGNSGPPAVSLGALEEYLQVQGREWERFAWLKSRVVAPRVSVTSGSAQAMRPVVLPFVFRRYLDYNVFDALRILHRQIRDHAAQRSAGHPERANDVKLSRGGIREIEFIVQLLQVVRGGQFPELRTRPTQDALQRLAKAGLMPSETTEALALAYVFLRQVEHRIQYLDDQQTHVLPTRNDDLAWIARTMGFAATPLFLEALAAHRDRVAQEFDQLLGAAPRKTADPTSGEKSGVWRTSTPQNKSAPPTAPDALDFDTLAAASPEGLRERLVQLREHPRVLALREDARYRLLRVLQRTIERVQSDANLSIEAALRMIDWLEPLLRRESYLALLLERPSVHARLLRLFGAARWPARYLVRHPGVIDELASDAMLTERFDAEEFARELESRRAALASTGEDDDEALLNLLRRAHHAEVFRTLARDVEGQISVEQVADDLSALAEVMLNVTTQWCWNRLKNRHREVPQFAIIAYGKLGGKELGYGSDLDIVFVFEDEDERAPEVYAALVRKLINWMTVKTGEGDLFEIDTALRPNGNSGLLVTTFQAYSNYQQQRGSNTAWTWEHQAMTRARFVMGDAQMRQRFDAVRLAVISAVRDNDALRTEIMAMRAKVSAAHPFKAERFDVKHSHGGMVDVEFAVQYLVLSASAQHSALTGNIGNIGLLAQAEGVGLLPQGVGQAAAKAYRALRQIQHRARLDEQAPQSDSPAAIEARAAVTTLWSAVFRERRPQPAAQRLS